MHDISDIVKTLREIVASRVHRYFPSLSNNFAITILHQGLPLVRKHSILFEIAIFDPSKKVTRGIFAKIPRVSGEEVTKEIYETMVTLHAFTTRLQGEMNVVRPLDYIPELGAILTERVEGDELSALLRHSPRGVEQGTLLRACGRFLCAYHRGLGELAWSTDFAPTFMERVQLYLMQLQQYGVGKAQVQYLLNEFERGADQLRRGIETCLTFDDYSVRNIIMHGNNLFIIEATQPRTKAIYDDFAQFLTSLTMLFWGSPWFFVGRRPDPRLHQQFLSGYFSSRIPLGIISLFYAKQLCFTWLRSLDSLALKQHGIASFFPIFPIQLRIIHQLFYRLITDQLRRANAGSNDPLCA
jgi:Phosphotransferase enzyme family